jgi:CBS domain containing-hemolysin-like protein
VAYPDESLRVVVYRMAETGFTRMPVVDRGDGRKLVGIVSLEDLLHARSRNLTEERTRERVLQISQFRSPFSAKQPRRHVDIPH